MKTNEIQKNLRGDYVVRIQTINHGVIKDFVFYNLSEAINFANRLTFEECEKMNENKDKNIVRYDVIVFLREDCFGYNCRIAADGKTYPSICCFSVRKL